MTHLLSQTGTEDHAPFIHMAVASRSLYSYPLSHVILILCPSSYQPCEFFLYFAFGISGGMQAFSSEGGEKKKLTMVYHMRCLLTIDS